jgi:hypothetical protein
LSIIEQAVVPKIALALGIPNFKGATTCSITTLSITTLSVMTLSIMTFSITTLSIMKLSITIKKCGTHHKDIQHNDTCHLISVMLSVDYAVSQIRSLC